ncbi:Zinc finger MYND domain-containing 17 [Chlorella sorokiniana]|uniref:Zinc finger MYND domain-containing 17 n=1 Tax=Chlorella sorokiniana TaxID=3076 RepID=A0A2P6TLJ1_CHLSO|nr:Zinc finger MYND domain-containing 17 [Chlorella sorokiniana]|eukprot:PRW45161.1 Zinc finger MYND domain-containing 17 [Chlorella sorokiniana]
MNGHEYMDILVTALHFHAAPLVAVLAADGLLAGMLRSEDAQAGLTGAKREALALKAAEALALLCNAGLLGPAAAKGEGRLKCSKCLVVQYCSTACSHADWSSGGHRRVCKALRAARDAEKAQAAAAAAAGGAASAEPAAA